MKHEDLSLDELDLVSGGMKWENFRPSENVEDRRDWTDLGINGSNGNAYSQTGSGQIMEHPYDAQSGGWGAPQQSDYSGPFVNANAMTDLAWAGSDYGDE